MYTFQDFESAKSQTDFIQTALREHMASDVYEIAETADLYSAQRNKTINEFVRTIFTMTGAPIEDFTASNNKLASNFFNRLNTQRVMYSLGNGVSFMQPDERGGDDVKELMGPNFDHTLTQAAYYALTHGVSFLFWNLDRLHFFKLTEFCPLYDEFDGRLRAGIRFWRLERTKPLTVVLYEEDGYTTYRSEGAGVGNLELFAEKRAYIQTVAYTAADGTEEVVGEDGYGTIPIVPMYGSRLKQSTLVGMQSLIDSYDLIRSGFANDLTDCAEVYWIVKNAGGMSDKELGRFRDRLKVLHIAPVDSDGGAGAEPFTQDIPYQARKQYLDDIRSGIYEDFGGLDVHAVSAGATNDHIDAAYQPLDENAADFEYQVASALKQILALQGIDDEPEFTRSRISNQKEQVEMVVMEAQWLDHATVLRKLPNISQDEATAILEAVELEDMARFGIGQEPSEE